VNMPYPIAKALESGLNVLIDLDPDNKPRLARMRGQVIELFLQGPDLHIYLLIHDDRIEFLPAFDGDVDTRIAGRLGAMIAMRTSSRGLFTGDVEISGNIETGKQFKRYLDALDIDWEEHLSQFVGDSVAYQLGRFFRGLGESVTQQAHVAQLNMGEYLSEEAMLVATATEIDGFTAAVDTLRADSDRLDARISVLESQQDKPA